MTYPSISEHYPGLCRFAPIHGQRGCHVELDFLLHLRILRLLRADALRNSCHSGYRRDRKESYDHFVAFPSFRVLAVGYRVVFQLISVVVTCALWSPLMKSNEMSSRV